MAPAFRVESIWLMLPIKGQIDEQLDDMAVIFTNRQDVDKGMKLSVRHFRRFGLSIHTGTLDAEGNLVKKSKTEILYIPPKHQRKMEYTSFVEQTVDVMIGGGRFMSFCDKFKYLGSWITYDLSDDFDIYQNRDMSLEIRVKLRYGCHFHQSPGR